VPHVIAPVTEDSRTILLALPALSTDLARLQGSRLHEALDRAEILLDALPQDSARSLLLISDGDFDEPGSPSGCAPSPSAASAACARHRQPRRRRGARPPRRPLIGPTAHRCARARRGQLRALAEAGGGLYRRADYRDDDTGDILMPPPSAAAAPGRRRAHPRLERPLLPAPAAARRAAAAALPRAQRPADRARRAGGNAPAAATRACGPGQCSSPGA
jgi:Ca-activated chloride channel family protein